MPSTTPARSTTRPPRPLTGRGRRRTVTLTVGAAAGLVLGAVASPAAYAGSAPDSPVRASAHHASFSYSGHPKAFTVPTGVTSARITAAGGSGGGSRGDGTWGGAGAQVSGTLAVTPGEQLTVAVGGRGGLSDDPTPGLGGWSLSGYQGGDGGRGHGSVGRHGAGGGGASVVQRNGSFVMIAAGGGGGGGLVGKAGNGGAGGDEYGQGAPMCEEADEKRGAGATPSSTYPVDGQDSNGSFRYSGAGGSGGGGGWRSGQGGSDSYGWIGNNCPGGGGNSRTGEKLDGPRSDTVSDVTVGQAQTNSSGYVQIVFS